MAEETREILGINLGYREDVTIGSSVVFARIGVSAMKVESRQLDRTLVQREGYEYERVDEETQTHTLTDVSLGLGLERHWGPWGLRLEAEHVFNLLHQADDADLDVEHTSISAGVVLAW